MTFLLLSCPLRLRQALPWALGSLVVGMEFLPLRRSQSGRAERLLRAVAVSLVPELPGPYSAVTNGGSCGKRHSLRVRFHDRCVRQERWRDQYVQRQGGQSKSVISHPKPVLLNSLFLFVALLPTLLSKLGICNLCFPSPLLHSLA